VLSKRWEPSRIPTPRFMGAWSCNENKGAEDMIPVLLGKNCENVGVWKPKNLTKQQQRCMWPQGKSDIAVCLLCLVTGGIQVHPLPATNLMLDPMINTIKYPKCITQFNRCLSTYGFINYFSLLSLSLGASLPLLPCI